jgi:hypothetical protein
MFGMAFAGAIVGDLMLWNSYSDNENSIWLNEGLRENFNPTPPVQVTTKDLVGKWTGKESWGNRFTITRRPDGTFSEVWDTSKSDAPHTPPSIRAEGYWNFEESRYARYYTKSSESGWINSPPEIIAITKVTPTELDYTADEGNPCIETRQ